MNLSLNTKRFAGILLLLLVLFTLFIPAHHSFALGKVDEGNGVPGTPAQNEKVQETEDKCDGWIASMVSIPCLIKIALAWLVKIWLWFVKWLLAASAYLFEFALRISIMKFGIFAGTSGGGSNFVMAGWRTIRDVCNLFFIFILLWTALQTILGLSHGTTKAVVNIVLAALLINFSATVTRVVIDSGNVLALTFYNSAKTWKNSKGEAATSGITGRVVNALDLTKASMIITAPEKPDEKAIAAAMSLDTSNLGAEAPPSSATADTDTKVDFSKLPFMQILLQGVGGTIFILMTAILFLAFAVMLLYRAFILLFLIVTSPFPFLIYALNGSISGSAKKWLDRLLCETYWVFLSMILLIVSFQVLEGGKSSFLGEGSGWGFVGTIAYFGIAISFLYASLIVGKEIGCSGTAKITGYASGKMSAVAAGTGAWLGRNTLARPVTAVSGALGDKMSQKQGVIGSAGRLALKGTEALKGTSFGVAGGSLKDTQEAKAKAIVDRNTELGKVDEAGMNRQILELQNKAGVHEAGISDAERKRRQDTIKGDIDRIKSEHREAADRRQASHLQSVSGENTISSVARGTIGRIPLAGRLVSQSASSVVATARIDSSNKDAGKKDAQIIREARNRTKRFKEAINAMEDAKISGNKAEESKARERAMREYELAETVWNSDAMSVNLKKDPGIDSAYMWMEAERGKIGMDKIR